MAYTSEQMRELERSLAFEYSQSLIECNCASVDDLPEHADDCRDWFDLKQVDHYAKASIKEAVAYLDARGLLIHLKGQRHVVAVRDEHEGHSLPAAESAGA